MMSRLTAGWSPKGEVSQPSLLQKLAPGHGAAPCPPVSETGVLLLDDPGFGKGDLEKNGGAITCSTSELPPGNGREGGIRTRDNAVRTEVSPVLATRSLSVLCERPTKLYSFDRSRLSSR